MHVQVPYCSLLQDRAVFDCRLDFFTSPLVSPFLQQANTNHQSHSAFPSLSYAIANILVHTVLSVFLYFLKWLAFGCDWFFISPLRHLHSGLVYF